MQFCQTTRANKHEINRRPHSFSIPDSCATLLQNFYVCLISQVYEASIFISESKNISFEIVVCCMFCFESCSKWVFKKKIIINIIVQMCSSRSSNYIFVVEDIIPIKMREIERIYVKNKSWIQIKINNNPSFWIQYRGRIKILFAL